MTCRRGRKGLVDVEQTLTVVRCSPAKEKKEWLVSAYAAGTTLLFVSPVRVQVGVELEITISIDRTEEGMGQ